MTKIEAQVRELTQQLTAMQRFALLVDLLQEYRPQEKPVQASPEFIQSLIHQIDEYEAGRLPVKDAQTVFQEIDARLFS